LGAPPSGRRRGVARGIPDGHRSDRQSARVPGREADARRILAELEATRTTAEVSGQPLVWALVALGRTDDAFRILEADFENRSVCFYLFDLVNHWFLEPLRADNRLQALFDTSGLLFAEAAERTDAQ
jgi:hypothetical protein